MIDNKLLDEILNHLIVMHDFRFRKRHKPSEFDVVYTLENNEWWCDAIIESRKNEKSISDFLSLYSNFITEEKIQKTCY